MKGETNMRIPEPPPELRAEIEAARRSREARAKVRAETSAHDLYPVLSREGWLKGHQ